jgi:hypothetical protein
MSEQARAEQEITRRVAAVEEDESRIGLYSTGEKLAVALVLDRKDWLEEWRYTILEAVERLGTEWTRAALAVQRQHEGS